MNRMPSSRHMLPRNVPGACGLIYSLMGMNEVTSLHQRVYKSSSSDATPHHLSIRPVFHASGAHHTQQPWHHKQLVKRSDSATSPFPLLPSSSPCLLRPRRPRPRVHPLGLLCPLHSSSSRPPPPLPLHAAVAGTMLLPRTSTSTHAVPTPQRSDTRSHRLTAPSTPPPWRAWLLLLLLPPLLPLVPAGPLMKLHRSSFG